MAICYFYCTISLTFQALLGHQDCSVIEISHSAQVMFAHETTYELFTYVTGTVVFDVKWVVFVTHGRRDHYKNQRIEGRNDLHSFVQFVKH
uniref:Putative secreted protein n=1 Tax=Amblyomma triste TaxID=251400 RepID=A0A023G1J3_AMBTT